MRHDADDEIAGRLAGGQGHFAHRLGDLPLVAHRFFFLFALALGRLGRLWLMRVLPPVRNQLPFGFRFDHGASPVDFSRWGWRWRRRWVRRGWRPGDPQDFRTDGPWFLALGPRRAARRKLKLFVKHARQQTGGLPVGQSRGWLGQPGQ